MKRININKELHNDNSTIFIADIQKQGTRPILKLLEKLGGWPVIVGENWMENSYSWEETLRKIHELGYTGYFPFTFSSMYNEIVDEDIIMVCCKII